MNWPASVLYLATFVFLKKKKYILNKHLIAGRFHIEVWFLTSLEKPKDGVRGLCRFEAAISHVEGAACLRWVNGLDGLSLSPTLLVGPPVLSCFVHVCCLPGSCKRLGLPPHPLEGRYRKEWIPG